MDSPFALRQELLASIWAMLPVIVMQAAATAGMIAIALLLTRSSAQPTVQSPTVKWPTPQRAVVLGLLLGLTNFAIGWFISWWMKGPLRPNLVIDVSLISGMLGGAPAALITGAISVYTRYVFAGPVGMAPVLAEATLYALAGIGLHRVVAPRFEQALTWQTVLGVWGFRVVLTYVGLGVGMLVGYPANLPLTDFVALRTLVLPLSFVILWVALLLATIDARIDRNRDLEYRLARTDAATGLPNRLALTEYLRALPGNAPATATDPSTNPGCLLVAQVTKLREIERRHGPQGGGVLWSRFGQPETASAVLAPLARYGPRAFQFGDFSLAISLQSTTLEALEQSGDVERFVALLADELGHAGPGLSYRCAVIDARIAVGTGGVPYRNITLALDSLDSGVAYYNDLLQRDRELDEEIEAALEHWVSRGDAPVEYQPKVRLADGVVTGAEALLRMRDSRGKPVSPMRAIGLFRRRGNLPQFEWAVLKTVVRWLADGGPADTRRSLLIAINITPESLRQPDFGERLVALLASSGVPGTAIRLELIEWSELVQLPEVRASIACLRAAGVTLALDDFGIGYSTLLLLTQLPIAEVKIDQTLIAALGSGASRPVVGLIVDAARQYGAVVVAEGVESEGTARIVSELGIQYAQGFHYAAALSGSHLLAFARKAG